MSNPPDRPLTVFVDGVALRPVERQRSKSIFDDLASGRAMLEPSTNGQMAIVPVAAAPPEQWIDIREEIWRQRMDAYVAAPGPKPPVTVAIDEWFEQDRARLTGTPVASGYDPGRDEGDV